MYDVCMLLAQKTSLMRAIKETPAWDLPVRKTNCVRSCCGGRWCASTLGRGKAERAKWPSLAALLQDAGKQHELLNPKGPCAQNSIPKGSFKGFLKRFRDRDIQGI